MSDQITLTRPVYPADVAALDNLSPDVRSRFEQWMSELDVQHARRGAPYGEGSLWSLTGAICWLDYFFMSYEPSQALADDATSFIR